MPCDYCQYSACGITENSIIFRATKLYHLFPCNLFFKLSLNLFLFIISILLLYYKARIIIKFQVSVAFFFLLPVVVDLSFNILYIPSLSTQVVDACKE